MSLKKVGKPILLGVPVLAGLIFIYVAASGNLGFYAPRKGKVTQGLNLEITGGQSRKVARVSITKEMTGGKPQVTLRQLTSFFALDPGSLSCSVKETEQLFEGEVRPDVVKRHGDKNRKIGDVVTLCLD